VFENLDKEINILSSKSTVSTAADDKLEPSQKNQVVSQPQVKYINYKINIPQNLEQ
jgi:hypothetical protein